MCVVNDEKIANKLYNWNGKILSNTALTTRYSLHSLEKNKRKNMRSNVLHNIQIGTTFEICRRLFTAAAKFAAS